MAYWCDDRNLQIEQRRLDAAQEDARRKIEARRKAERETNRKETLMQDDRQPKRFASFKPANSRWLDGWLISMTSISGFEMVQYPSDRPFVLSRAEWNALPEYGPNRPECR